MDLASFLGEIHTTSKSNFYGLCGLNGPFLDYFIMGRIVQKCVLFEVSTSSILEVKFRPLPNRIFMLSMG